MIRRIIQIDEDKCNGWWCLCQCLPRRCHRYGKRKSKIGCAETNYCDGLLATVCQPVRNRVAMYFCGTGSLLLTTTTAVKENMKKKGKRRKKSPAFSGCPGQRMRPLTAANQHLLISARPFSYAEIKTVGRFRLNSYRQRFLTLMVPKLLIAADCTAYAYCKFPIMILSKEKSPLSAVQNWMTSIIQKKLTEIIPEQ